MWNLLIGPVSNLLSDIIDKVVPDKNDAQKAKEALAAGLQQAVLAAEQSQLDIDKTEAASPSIFVSGWRPGVAWVCVFGFAYQFVLQPFIGYALSIHSTYNGLKIPPPPSLDSTQMMTLLFALLGLGGMRTVEKVNGVATVNMNNTTSAFPKS
jgi:hypothetical protein